MSQETIQWLNTNTLIGFTDQRGRAWHYRAQEQGAETNHYPGAIPVEDVQRRLFHWQAVEGDVQTTILLPDGVDTIVSPDLKTIVRPDTREILGVFKRGYQIHQHDEWLLDTVAVILDDDLKIGSAGLLKGGAVAWVSVEVPETITTPEGVEFRPNLLAAGSHDGSLSSTFGRVVQVAVCDNTLSVALGEANRNGQRLKVRHTRNSNIKLKDAREALALVHTIADDFAAQVAELTSIKVSDGDWAKFLDTIAPPPSDEASKRSNTMRTNKREALDRLWETDMRVAPWRGTAFGAVQAVNTYTHHEGTVRGAERAERNMLRAVEGGVDKLDRQTALTIRVIVAA